SRSVNNKNIWKYDLDSQSFTQLTYGPGPDTLPLPDPDGKGLYFVNGRNSGSLSRYDVKTNTNTTLLSEFASQPSISYDGKRMMYIRLVDPNKVEELWTSDIDGNNKLKIATSTHLGTGLWSPDDSHISFMDQSEEPTRAYIAKSDGSDIKEV